MAKAILIIEMPSCCDECDLKESYCHVDDNDTCRAGGCPLVEVPQKKDENKAYDDCEYYRMQGYNACIDEILGGAE